MIGSRVSSPGLSCPKRKKFYMAKRTVSTTQPSQRDGSINKANIFQLQNCQDPQNFIDK